VSGTLTLNSDGSFTYTPDADFNGVDSFAYRASDGILDSNLATVSITVISVDDAPVAVDDAYSTDVGTALTVEAPGVLENDSDVDSDSLTAVLDTAPANGTLTLNGDGSFTYTPDAAFTGTDSFGYRANDGTLDSTVATVVITVNATPLTVTGITPDIAGLDTTVNVTVSGTGFQAGAVLALENGQGPAPDITNVVVVDDTTLTATFIVKQGGPPRDRTWDIRVTNPDGGTDLLVAGFTVTTSTAATGTATSTSGTAQFAQRPSLTVI
jgi:hypothetical protein